MRTERPPGSGKYPEFTKGRTQNSPSENCRSTPKLLRKFYLSLFVSFFHSLLIFRFRFVITKMFFKCASLNNHHCIAYD